MYEYILPVYLLVAKKGGEKNNIHQFVNWINTMARFMLDALIIIWTQSTPQGYSFGKRQSLKVADS